MTDHTVDLPPRPCTTTAAAALPCPSNTVAPLAEAPGTAPRVVCTPPNNFLASALELAQLGIRVHPLEHRSKKPHLRGYQRHASTDAATIRDWSHRWPDANIGFIAGDGSGTFVLDVDTRHGGDRSLRLLEAQHPELPPTWQYSTSDGPRICLAYPATGIVKTGTMAPGITVLSDGANVVGPGSIHPSGHRYAWMECYDPGSLPLAGPPPWLLDLLQAKRLYSCRTAAPATTRQASKGDPPRLLASSTLDPAAKGVSGSLNGAAVKSLFGQWEEVQRCLKVLGLAHVRVGEKFWCIMHPDEHPSAAILSPRDADDTYAYIDFHHAEDERFRIPLPLLYYCQMTGASTSTATRLPEPSFLAWSLRLLAAAGVITGIPVQAPKLKGQAPQEARRVYAGFLELLSLKWLYTAHAASPFTWRFGEDWLPGMTNAAVGRGVRWLLGRGYFRFVDWWRNMMLFLPGSRALINRRRKRRHDPETKQEALIQEVAKDEDTMLAPDDGACPDCGRAGFIDSIGRCHWCIALEVQQRLDEKKAIYQPPAFASG